MLACHATAPLWRRCVDTGYWFWDFQREHPDTGHSRFLQGGTTHQTWYTLLYPDLSDVTAPLSAQVRLMSVFVLFGQRGLSSLVCCLHCVLFRELLLCAGPPLLWGGGCARAFLLEGQGANSWVFLGFRYSWDCAGGLFLGGWGQ